MLTGRHAGPVKRKVVRAGRPMIERPDSSGGVVRGRVLVPLAFADDLLGVLDGRSVAEPGWHRPGGLVEPFQCYGGDSVGHSAQGQPAPSREARRPSYLMIEQAGRRHNQPLVT